MRRSRLLQSCLISLLLALTLPLRAQTLLPIDSGYVQRTGTLGGIVLAHDPAVRDVLVSSGRSPGISGVSITRNAYALFQIDPQLARPLSAVLSFEVTPTGFPGRIDLHDVLSSVASFEQVFSGVPTQDGLNLLADLGGGVTYGGLQLDPGPTLMLSFILPQVALDSLYAVRGGVFGVGFSGTGALAGFLNLPLTLQQVTLTISAVPEPSAVWMGLLGLLLLWALRARMLRR